MTRPPSKVPIRFSDIEEAACHACGADILNAKTHCPVCGVQIKRPDSPKKEAVAAHSGRDIVVVGALVILVGVAAVMGIVALVDPMQDEDEAQAVPEFEESVAEVMDSSANGPEAPVEPGPPEQDHYVMADQSFPPAASPGMMDPGMMNPGMMNPGMMNPGMMNPGMGPGGSPAGQPRRNTPSPLDSLMTPSQPGVKPIAPQPKKVAVKAPGEDAFNAGRRLAIDARLHDEEPEKSRALMKQALVKYREAIAVEYPPAMEQVGDLYLNRSELSQGPSKALHYYIMAGRLDLESAQRKAVALYGEAEPGSLDCVECPGWLRELADQGDGESLLLLAHWTRHGTHLARDPQRAADLYRHAITRGNKEALEYLGELYMSGELDAPDPYNSYPLFQQAANYGYENGLRRFAEWSAGEMRRQLDASHPIAHSGDQLQVRKSSGLVVRGSFKNIDRGELVLTTTHGEQAALLEKIDVNTRGRVDPVFREEMVGVNTLEFLIGLGAKSPSASLNAALQALELPPLSSPEYQRDLGMSWYQGGSEEVDYPRAFLWLKMAAHREDPIARHFFGLMHYHGEGTDKDEALALGWIKLASDAAYAPATRFINQHRQREGLILQQQTAVQVALEKIQLQHAQALERITDESRYIPMFNRGEEGSKFGATAKKINKDSMILKTSQ